MPLHLQGQHRIHNELKILRTRFFNLACCHTLSDRRGIRLPFSRTLPYAVDQTPVVRSSESCENRTECGFAHPSKEGQGIGVQLLVLGRISNSSS